MSTGRKFAAFDRDGRYGSGISEIPKDGFCISVFLIIHQDEKPRNVLMGRLNPKANWLNIGALTPDRIEAHSKGWMLPSSHLIYGESPSDAVQRVIKEQLENIKVHDLRGPKVYSDIYQPRRHPERKEHWDLQFLFEADLGIKEQTEKLHPAWNRLQFLDIDSVDVKEIARSHEDILARI